MLAFANLIAASEEINKRTSFLGLRFLAVHSLVYPWAQSIIKQSHSQLFCNQYCFGVHYDQYDAAHLREEVHMENDERLQLWHPQICSKGQRPRWQKSEQSEQSETTPASCGTAQPIPPRRFLGFEIIMNVVSHFASAAQQQKKTATGQASGAVHETTHTERPLFGLRHSLMVLHPATSLTVN
ncbi:hypothetical protein CSAL01_11832 [Colletotrichum salicis]|uniref:Uncharacterized protein n=1 Tax=Colletotrichum salicis TaxID=1209931 RepID=A0A135V0G7_9PEZI|nr:hypothetical protein CSAL01_11832 [Colletotrichum salicis]